MAESRMNTSLLRRRKGLSFRVLLLGVVLGLILASTLSTTWLSARGMRSVILTLRDRQIETTLDAVTGRVEDLFEPSDRLLFNLSKRIRTGTLSLEHPLEVAKALSESLEFEDGIKWICFGYPDGSFAGAWTHENSVVLNTSQPGKGRPQEWELVAQGEYLPFERNDVPDSFDARERVWFQLAQSSREPTWTPPYEFADGGTGISVALAVRDENGTLLGVLSVDFLLKDVTSYLEKLKEEFQGDSLVFSIRGHIIASAKDLDKNPLTEEIRERLENEQVWESLKKNGEHLVMDFSTPSDTYIVGVRRAGVLGNLDCVSAIIFSHKQTFGAMEENILHGAMAALVALAVALCIGGFLAGRIANPLKALSSAVSRIGRFDLSAHDMPNSGVREIRTLSESIELLRSGLQSFSHYVPVDLVRDLVKSGQVAALGGERRETVLFFCDLAGFTAYAESTPPEESVATLTGYFEDFGEAIELHGGVIDKFMGDGIMALFNAPQKIPAPAAAACRAALTGIYSMRRRDHGFAVRIGLHLGECLVGNVGTSTRFSYTAIGDCVNLASRLEGLNKSYGTRIIASAAFREAAGDEEFLWRPLDRVTVAGRTAPLDIFELVESRSVATPYQHQLVETYTKALEAYHGRDLDTTLRLLQPLEHQDEPSLLLLLRVRDLLAHAKMGEWDSISRHDEK